MDKEKKQLMASVAKTIFHHLNELAIDEASARRWVWELLQNAIDIADSSRTLKTEFEFSKDNVKFKHNGIPFNEDSLNNLFYKDGSKIEEVEPTCKEINLDSLHIGNFGTGFLTTHLLSKRVHISGIYKKNDSQYAEMTNFILDRSGSHENISKSLENYSNERTKLEKADNVKFIPEQINNTVFSYQLNSDGFKTAEIGIKDLKNSIYYSLIFISKIKKLNSVSLIDNILNYKTEYSLSKTEPFIEGLNRNKINNTDKEKYIVTLDSKCNKTSLAFEIEILKNDKVHIINKPQETPVLFKVFPLIGSENFGFPFLINSLCFKPTKEREGIILKGGDQLKTYIEENQKVIHSVIVLYKQVVDTIIGNTEYSWDNLYEIAKIELPDEKTPVDKDWYKGNIQKPLRIFLMEKQIVRNCNTFIYLKNARFPFIKYDNSLNEKFWDLAVHLNRNKFPKKSDLSEWLNIITSDWEKTTNRKLRYKIKDLVEDIAQFKNVKNLAKYLTFDENMTYLWLNKVVNLIIETKNIELIEKYEILPNQYGIFVLKDDNLFIDKRIEEEIKFILKILGKDWKKMLLHNSIKNVELSIKTNKLLISEMNSIFRVNEHPNIQTAVLQTISIFDKQFKPDTPQYRIWRTAKDLFPETPKIKELPSLTGLDLHLESIDYILSLFANTIENLTLKQLTKIVYNNQRTKGKKNKAKKRISKNNSFLFNSKKKPFPKKQTKHKIVNNKKNVFSIYKWLNAYYKLYTDLKKHTLLTEKQVFLNQRNIFTTKNELQIDHIKNTKLLNIVNLFPEQNIQHSLLHSEIDPIKNIDKYSIEKFSEGYNKLLKENLENQKLIEDVVLNFISFIPKIDVKERFDLINFIKKVFKINTLIYIEQKTENIEWNETLKIALRILIEKVHNCDNLNSLSIELTGKEYNDENNYYAQNWLNNLIAFFSTDFVSEFEIDYLNKYKIIPNQNLKFCSQDELHEDIFLNTNEIQYQFDYYQKEHIPEKLKDILELLTNQMNSSYEKQDWRNILLKNGISCILKNDPKDTKQICILIDNLVKENRSDGKKDTYKAINELYNWINDKKNENFREFFSWFSANKAQAVLDTYSSEDKANIDTIMQSGKTKELAELISIDGVNIDEIKGIAEQKRAESISVKINRNNGEKIEELLKENLTNAGFEIDDKDKVGKDFTIKLSKNNIDYYVEVKSIKETSNTVSMTKRQGDDASQKPDNYSLCVVQVEQETATAEQVKEKATFTTNIGYEIQNKVNLVTNFKTIKAGLQVNDDIEIVFDGNEQTKYRIKENIWNGTTSLDFNNFVNYLKMK